MRPQILHWFLPVLAVVVCASSARAQHSIRRGFWAEAGGGGGNIHIGCATCEEPTVTYGRSGYVRIGGGISRRVLWGIELFGLLDEEFTAGPTDETVSIENASIAPIVIWYPWKGGVFFKGGIGVTNVAVVTPGIDDDPPIVVSATGSGLNFGVGLDVPVHRWFAVTANFGVYYSAAGDVRLVGNPVDDVITTVYQANFAITLR
jgi:hypothetical protein